MTYIASESFRSSGGERFHFGQEIGNLEYNRLTREEKMKFRRKYADSESSYIPPESDYPATGAFGTSITSSDDSLSSSSHFDYGGGDTGGGGSDSSWDSGSSSDSGGSDGGGGDGGGD